MPACSGRQGARCCAVLWSLLLIAVPFGRQAWADDQGGGGSGLGDVLGIPRILNNPQYPEINAQPQTQNNTANTQPSSRGRAMMEERVKVVKRPTSAKAARKAAIAALPMDKISESCRERVLQIVNSNGMFRELPTYRFEVDPRVYYFFMNHPDVAVSIWRVMQISEFQNAPDRCGWLHDQRWRWNERRD